MLNNESLSRRFTRVGIPIFTGVVLGATGLVGCVARANEDGSSVGGKSTSGASAGGSFSAGGSSASGGSPNPPASGGTGALGGSNAAGGAPGSGGSPAPQGGSNTQGGSTGASGGSMSPQGGGLAKGGNAASGAPASGGSVSKGGSTSTGNPGFGTPMQSGMGKSSDRYYKAEVTRNGANYYFMANGWGPGFQSQTVSWNGTSFTVNSMQGAQGGGYEPASYPTMFCGVYSDSQSGPCALPKPLTEIMSIRTGWRWQPNGNSGQYNAAYDVWLSTNGTIQGHSSFLMVWLRDPPGQQPAGSKGSTAVSVANVPGVWDVWSGEVGGKNCISYVRAEGQDSLELEFDVMDFVRDVPMRGASIPGSHVLSVAVGFEIWNGPVNNLVSSDFYVEVR